MKKYSFTLIELLVVVGIIAMLAAILLPALSRAKESGKSIACRSNLKNCIVGSLNYADDSNGWGPPHYVFYSGAPTPERTWAVMLDYTGHLPMSAVSLCPSWVPSHKDRTKYQCSGMFLRASWGGNITPCRWLPLTWGTTPLTVAPSEFWVMGDSIRIDSLTQVSHIAHVSGNVGRLHFRHAGQANIACLDGHVDGVTVRKGIDYGLKVFYTTDEVVIP